MSAEKPAPRCGTCPRCGKPADDSSSGYCSYACYRADEPAPIQTPEELVRGWDKLYPFTPPTGLIVLADRIRERDEARDAEREKRALLGDVLRHMHKAITSDDSGKGASVAESTEVATQRGTPAPDPIPDDFLPPGLSQPESFCNPALRPADWHRIMHAAFAIWRAALRAERERANFAWKRMPCGNPGACMVGGPINAPEEPACYDAECDWCACERAERAAAARVRRMARWIHDHYWGFSVPFPCAEGTSGEQCDACAYYGLHEPALAAELGAAKGGADRGE